MLDDTHPKVRRLQEDLLRAMTPERRLRWIEVVYGKDLAARMAPFADRLGARP